MSAPIITIITNITAVITIAVILRGQAVWPPGANNRTGR
jgi:hypothetical protein